MGELMAKKYPISFASGSIRDDEKHLQRLVERTFTHYTVHPCDRRPDGYTDDYILTRKSLSVKRFFEGKEFTCDEMIEFSKAGMFDNLLMGSSPLLMDGETITVYDDYIE